MSEIAAPVSAPTAPASRPSVSVGEPSGSGRAPTGSRAALVRLLAVVAAGVGVAVWLNAVPILVVVLALVVMIMVHELGHFVVAKVSGMKVTEYFLGFGPRLWAVRRGETTYGVKAVPAGGYVRIVGMTTLEDVEPEDEARSYRQATFPRRFGVGIAGSTMHFVMAFLLLFSLYAIAGAPVPSAPTISSLATFAHGVSPAERAGLEAGDTIVSIDGQRFGGLDGLIAYVNARPGRPLTFVVRRASRDLTLTVTPVDGRHVVEQIDGQAIVAADPNGPPKGVIGVALSASRDATVGPFVALGRAGSAMGALVTQTFSGLGAVFSPHGLGAFAHQVATAGSTGSGTSATSGSGASSGSQSGSQSGSGQVLSILGAVQIGAQALRHNVGELLVLLAAINIFVGLFNLFPMLPLDGGHVAIAVYERIRSRRGRHYHADVRKLMPVAYVFLLFIVVFGLGALYVNIVHPAQLPGG